MSGAAHRCTSPIAINATILGERPTGLGTYALGLIGGLAGQGHDLCVLTSWRTGLPPGVRTEDAPAAVRPEHGARGHWARLAWSQVALPLKLRRTRPSVLLNMLPEGPLLSPTPQVTVVHDLLPLLYPAEYPRARLYFRFVVPRLLRASRAVLTNSERTRLDVISSYRGIDPSAVHVIHAGYDDARFAPQAAAPRSRPYLLYVGNIAPHKNLLRLVDAFAAVAQRVVADLVIRGSGRPQHVARLRAHIDRAGVGGRVDWRPYEAPADLPRLYAAASALILPSTYEGFGLTALEAMACGTPVIASTAASIPEVVGDAALMVDPLDVPALSEAMRAVLEDGTLASDLRARGPERARRFSWERTAMLALPHLACA